MCLHAVMCSGLVTWTFAWTSCRPRKWSLELLLVTLSHCGSMIRWLHYDVRYDELITLWSSDYIMNCLWFMLSAWLYAHYKFSFYCYYDQVITLWWGDYIRWLNVMTSVIGCIYALLTTVCLCSINNTSFSIRDICYATKCYEMCSSAIVFLTHLYDGHSLSGWHIKGRGTRRIFD